MIGAIGHYRGVGVLCLLAPLAACGRLGFSDQTDGGVKPPGDADPDAPDAATTSGPCELDPVWREPVGGQPFGAVNSDSVDWGCEISDDGRMVMFSSVRPGGEHLWMAQRAGLDQRFGAATEPPVLRSDATDGEPSFNDTELYFVSTRTGSECLYMSKRTGDTFETPRPLDPNVFCGVFDSVDISHDGLRLYYELDGRHLVSRRDTTAVDFTRGDEITGWTEALNFCSLSSDELAIYCEAKPGSQLQIWKATRSNRSDLFLDPARLPDFDETRNAGDPTLTADGKLMLYSANAPGDDHDLRIVERRCK